MKLNRALSKVTVLVRGVARDFAQVHRSNSTLTLLLNAILARITVDADAVVQPCFDYLLILPSFFTGEVHAAYWLKGSYAPASENTTLRNRQNPSISINDYCHYQCRPRLGVVTLPILPIDKLLLPTGKQLFFVTDFPKLPWESFHGYAKKNKRISHDN